jgi:glutathione S-transferase
VILRRSPLTILLYDLCAADRNRRFSPHCWKVRMALAHKGLAFETRATPFTRIWEIGGGFSPTVPVIDDGGRLIRESFDIAVHLEETYPSGPSLFRGEGGRAAARFVESFALTVVHPRLLALIVKDINDRLDSADKIYFRKTREERLGRTLEATQAGREERLPAFQEALQPLRHLLSRQPFLGGVTPLFADYILFGVLQWARVISPFRLLDPSDPVAEWFERCLDLHGGEGRNMAAAA